MTDSIFISGSDSVLNGLRDMMQAAFGDNEYVHEHVNIEIALLIIECAKYAPDKDKWFPRGKWATIQGIQKSVDEQLHTLKFKDQL